jgi:hypothetical protein
MMSKRRGSVRHGLVPRDFFYTVYVS